MKIIDTVKTLLGRKTSEVEKGAGIYVARLLLPQNAQKWHDWAVKHAIPNVVPPEQMHVTIVHSTVEVLAPLVETTMNITTTASYGGGCFAMFGPNEEDLVFAMRGWDLYDRHWAFIDNGAVCEWDSYRPHLTIAKNLPAGFEFPKEALLDVPALIVLGPEYAESLKVNDVAKGGPRVAVPDDVKTLAADLVKSAGESLSAVDVFDLADVARGRLSVEVAKRLGESVWAPEPLKALATPKEAPVRKKIEREYTVQVREAPQEILKARNLSEVAKTNDEDQIVLGVASVSTVDGELVTDLHGDQVTTRALVEFNRSLISGSRAGKFDHEGDVCTQVVAGMVLTEDWQKSLGIDLGYEPYLVEIHVPDPVDWAEVKKGEWMLSIAGTMWYWETEADAEV